MENQYKVLDETAQALVTKLEIELGESKTYVEKLERLTSDQGFQLAEHVLVIQGQAKILKDKPCYTQYEVDGMDGTTFKHLILEPQFKYARSFNQAQSLFGTYWIQKNRTLRYIMALLLSKALDYVLQITPEGRVI